MKFHFKFEIKIGDVDAAAPAAAVPAPTKVVADPLPKAPTGVSIPIPENLPAALVTPLRRYGIGGQYL